MEINFDPSKLFKGINRSQLLAFAIAVFAVWVLFYLASLSEVPNAQAELGWFWYFISRMAKFGIQGVGINILALLLVFLTNLIRNFKWFDAHGPGVEIGTVRDRVGTPEERPGDNTACGMQWLGGSIIIAFVNLAFFLVIAK